MSCIHRALPHCSGGVCWIGWLRRIARRSRSTRLTSSGDDRRVAAAGRWGFSRVLPAPHRARQAIGRRCGRGGRGGARALPGRGDAGRRRREGYRRSWPDARRRRGDRPCERGRRRRRPPLAAGEDRQARAVSRAPVAHGDVLRLLERPGHQHLRDNREGRPEPRVGGGSHPRWPDRGWLRLADRGVPSEPTRRRGQLPRGDRARFRVRRTGPCGKA